MRLSQNPSTSAVRFLTHGLGRTTWQLRAWTLRPNASDIINGVLDIYQKDNGIREVVSDISKAKLNDYQKRLDKIRHYARYDMTNPDTQSMDILEAG